MRPRGQGGEAGDEEVQSREGDHVDGELSQVSVKLAGESQASGNAAQGRTDEVIKVAVGRRSQLEGPEADIVKRLVVYAIRLVRVLHQLMHRERAVVGLNHGVRYLWKEARIEADVRRMASRLRVSGALAATAYTTVYTNERVCTSIVRRQRARYCPIKDKRSVPGGRFVSHPLYLIPRASERLSRCAATKFVPRMIPDTRGNSKRNS